MKRCYFFICCFLSFGFTCTYILSQESLNGVMNHGLHAMQFDASNGHYLHAGMDIFWTFSDDASTSDRPYLPAFSGGALLLKAYNIRNDNAAADLCLNPVPTLTFTSGNTGYQMLSDPKLWFGANHCDWKLLPEVTMELDQGTYIYVAESNSKLDGLHDKICGGYINMYASTFYPQYAEHCKPSGFYEIYQREFLIPCIPPGAKMAVMGNYNGVNQPKKVRHFHIMNYAQDQSQVIENISNFSAFRSYLEGVLTNAPSPQFTAEEIVFRQNYRDHVCTAQPSLSDVDTTGTPIDIRDKYVFMHSLTPTPAYGLPLPDRRVCVFHDVDIIQNAFTINGYKSTLFDVINFYIYKIEPEPISTDNCLRFRASDMLIDSASTYALPWVDMTDNSYGVTFPPHESTQVDHARVIKGTEICNGDYGYIHEYHQGMSSYNDLLDMSTWLSNPDAVEGGCLNTKIVRAPWILTNLHTKVVEGQFRFDPRDRYLCWNTNVHREYKSSNQCQWWLPPQIGNRTYPPLANPSGAPVRSPDFTNNLAYHPDYAYFPDGRYNIKSDYEVTNGQFCESKSADFFVNNYKPYLKYICIQQEELNWNVEPDKWRDPDVSDDWLNLDDTTEVTFSPFPGVNKKYRKEFLSYLAYWKVRADTGSHVGQSAIMDLCSHDGNDEILHPYMNFDNSNSNTAGKKWIHGRKPVYIELHFSEPIDIESLCLDIQDRYDQYRAMIQGGCSLIQLPPNINENSEIFEYFDMSNDNEIGIAPKIASHNTIIFVKLPAFRYYETEALFDAAERIIAITATDEAGTPLACLETKEINTALLLCRDNDGVFPSANGDAWRHRISIDSVSKSKTCFNPVGTHNWPDVEQQIDRLENNLSYDDITNWHFRVPSCQAWTEEWDPKRNNQRRSIDYYDNPGSPTTWIYDSAGSRETKIEIGEFVQENRNNTAKMRIMAGTAVEVQSTYTLLFVKSTVVDFIGNKDVSYGYIPIPGPPFAPPSYTGIPRTYRTDPPITIRATTQAPVTRTIPGDYFTPTNTVPYVGPPSPSPSLSLRGMQGDDDDESKEKDKTEKDTKDKNPTL